MSKYTITASGLLGKHLIGQELSAAMAQNVVEGGWRNKLAYMGLHDLQMPIIHTWNVSLNMWNYHTNYRCPVPI